MKIIPFIIFLFVLLSCNSSRQSNSRDSNTVFIDGKKYKAIPSTDSHIDIVKDTSYLHNKRIKREYIVPKYDNPKKVE